MKFKFSIHYITTWGQSLHVDLTTRSAKGHERHYDIPMQTIDGDLWQTETSMLTPRGSSINSITYYYKVENAKGNTLREEWMTTKRNFSIDSTRDYIFEDLWRDTPSFFYCYLDIYHTISNSRVERTTYMPQWPLFYKTILFRVSAPQIHEDEQLAICGNRPSLGSWNEARYLPMEYMGMGEWMLAVDMDNISESIEYKYVVIDRHTKRLKQWEEGCNRRANVRDLETNQVLVAYGEPLRIKTEDFRLAGITVSVDEDLRYDLGNIKTLIDWCSNVGLRQILLSPLNPLDSVFAIDPLYAPSEIKYEGSTEELRKLKEETIRLQYEEDGRDTIASESYINFTKKNAAWLESYTDGSHHTADEKILIGYTQYILHQELQEISEYARTKGVSLGTEIKLFAPEENEANADSADRSPLLSPETSKKQKIVERAFKKVKAQWKLLLSLKEESFDSIYIKGIDKYILHDRTMQNILSLSSCLIFTDSPQGIDERLESRCILSINKLQGGLIEGFPSSYKEKEKYASVATIAAPDAPALSRLWEDNPYNAQQYWSRIMKKKGFAPDELQTFIAKDIIVHNLSSSSFIALFKLCDLLEINHNLRCRKDSCPDIRETCRQEEWSKQINTLIKESKR